MFSLLLNLVKMVEIITAPFCFLFSVNMTFRGFVFPSVAFIFWLQDLCEKPEWNVLFGYEELCVRLWELWSVWHCLPRRTVSATARSWRPGRTRRFCPTGHCWPRAVRPPCSSLSTTERPKDWPTSMGNTCRWVTRQVLGNENSNQTECFMESFDFVLAYQIFFPSLLKNFWWLGRKILINRILLETWTKVI